MYELQVPTDRDLQLMEQAFSVLAQFACAIRRVPEAAAPCGMPAACCVPSHALPVTANACRRPSPCMHANSQDLRKETFVGAR